MKTDTNDANNGATPQVQRIELDEISPEAVGSRSLFDANLQLIQGVKVALSVSVGNAQLTVGELFALKEKSILSLNKLTTEPVDVLLDGKVVARGELVVVDDYFGVSITQLPKAP